MKIRVLATEDDAIHEEKLRMVMDTCGFELLDVVADPNDLVRVITATRPDVLLMDIDLGEGKSGIELVKEVNEMYDIPTVYLTSYIDSQTFQEAKKTLPSAYITKPYKAEDLIRAIELSVFNNQNNSITNAQKSNSLVQGNFLFLKDGNTLSKIEMDDIKLVEADDKYCYLFTPDKKYMLKERLKNILIKLKRHKYCQIHRKFIINLEAIETIDLKHNQVNIIGKSISIGKSYKQEFLSNINAMG